jgi:formate hydrogenlyase transcriptional activator
MNAREPDRIEDAATVRASEEFKSRLIASSRDCIKVLDLDGRLLSMNAGGAEVLEICDLDSVLGAFWIDFWQGTDREAARSAVDAARRGGVGRFVGYFPTRQTQQPKWWDVIVNAIPDAAGRPEKLLAISRDVTEWKRADELLRAITEGTASVAGVDFFEALVRHLAGGLHVRWVFVAECLPNLRARSLAFWADHALRENFEYELPGTPCMEVARGRVCHVPDRLSEMFPADKGMIEMGTTSYLGVPLLDSRKRIIGHLVVFDDKPMPVDPLALRVLETFAARAGIELERQKAEEELRRLSDENAALLKVLAAENAYLQEEIRSVHNFEEIVGNSPALLEVLRQVDQAAPTDSTVLIQGETGTGKELIARALHDRSARKARPLVKVNCGAISAGLVESELFGHVKGAFTGALTHRDGRFKLADGGTIFLDEVGDLPLDTQVKLLRVLQEQEFEPVGSSQTIRVDVRIIAATHRDLSAAVRAGNFRSDLFYRLNVLPITIPPLRERSADIPLLVAFFLQRFARKLGKPVKQVSDATLRRLMTYSWPGNIRELQNVIERAVVLSTGQVIKVDESALPVLSADSSTGPVLPRAVARVTDRHQLEETAADQANAKISPAAGASEASLQDVERRHIHSVLMRTNWIIEGERGAARILNLHPSTLRSRMQKLGIARPGA